MTLDQLDTYEASDSPRSPRPRDWIVRALEEFPHSPDREHAGMLIVKLSSRKTSVVASPAELIMSGWGAGLAAVDGDLDLEVPVHSHGPQSFMPETNKAAPVSSQPLIGRLLANTWDSIRGDPTRFMRRTLYLVAALTVASSMLAATNAGLAVLLAAGVLIVWGLASLVVYAVSGATIFNPVLGLLFLIGGVGTLIVAIIALAS